MKNEDMPGGEGSVVTLRGEEARYVTKVLRLKAGDRITLFDSGGMEAGCAISSADGREANLLVEGVEKVDRESNLDIVLCQALPKGKKMDLVIQKGTELGVKRFVPFISSRSVPRPEKGEKAGRWEKIALEAARQCGRNFIPAVEDITGFGEMLKCLSGEMDGGILRLIPWEGEESNGIRSSFKKWIDSPPKEIIILIGPEGGFAEQEAEEAKRAGFIPVTLGKRLLRTETAGLAVVSILQFLWGDMG